MHKKIEKNNLKKIFSLRCYAEYSKKLKNNKK